MWSGLSRAAQGAGTAVPSLLVPAILRAVLPGVYRPFPHYLVLVATDHLSLYAAATAWWVVLRSYRSLEDEAGRRKWDDFFAFSCGFYALAAVALVLGGWARPDIYASFGLPVLRVATILLSSILMVVYFESYGIFRVLYAIAYGALPFVAGLVTYLDRTHHAAAAAIAAVAFLAIAALAWRRKELF